MALALAAHMCQDQAVVAIKAMAHKLARACDHVMREQRPFEVQRAFA